MNEELCNSYDEAWAEGETAGQVKTLVALIRKGRLSLSEAAEELNVTEEEFKRLLNSNQ